MSRQETHNLDQLQRWTQSVITHPFGVEQGICSRAATEQIDVESATVEQVITRSKALTSIERLRIYANAYYARLLDCMREFFPALVHTLGEELFDEFAFGYLQKYPSRSYTLDRLADNFVQYLEETRPNPADPGSETDEESTTPDWPDFMIDLARLEWSIEKVFDGPGVEHEPLLTVDDLLSIPQDSWAEARLLTVPCLMLLAFQFPVNDYYTAFRKDEDPPLPESAESYLALTRRDYIVRRYGLSGPQYRVLKSLVDGKTVGESIESIAGEFGNVEMLAESLQNWFRIWSAAPLFQSVLLPE